MYAGPPPPMKGKRGNFQGLTWATFDKRRLCALDKRIPGAGSSHGALCPWCNSQMNFTARKAGHGRDWSDFTDEVRQRAKAASLKGAPFGWTPLSRSGRNCRRCLAAQASIARAGSFSGLGSR